MLKTKIFNTILLFLVLLIVGNATAKAQSGNDSTSTVDHPIKVSLITFYPGNEIFEVFGHS